jgi:hypothetical protein
MTPPKNETVENETVIFLTKTTASGSVARLARADNAIEVKSDGSGEVIKNRQGPSFTLTADQVDLIRRVASPAPPGLD